MDVRHRDLLIDADGVSLPGDLALPPGPTAIVAFAHGSGSSRSSPRNIAVSQRLNRDGLATVLFDLLTEDEARDRRLVFDIGLLSRRLSAAVERVSGEPGLGRARVGLFGASTGAAAALVASVSIPDVGAIVSRGGRPDMAGEALERVTAPTLLIVGGADPEVLALNRKARAWMRAQTRLEVVPGATHLFDEPGTLERVAELASAWFVEHVT
ncbi:MAG TPA: dienelactone hydrolase family protein [Actinomycetota bacterium]|nr:dienelactone hydrolase family protein [Actinomycetota bacterium]